MRYIILFGVIAAVVADLLFLNGEYTKAVGQKLGGVGGMFGSINHSLWGV